MGAAGAADAAGAAAGVRPTCGVATTGFDDEKLKNERDIGVTDDTVVGLLLDAAAGGGAGVTVGALAVAAVTVATAAVAGRLSDADGVGDGGRAVVRGGVERCASVRGGIACNVLIPDDALATEESSDCAFDSAKASALSGEGALKSAAEKYGGDGGDEERYTDESLRGEVGEEGEEGGGEEEEDAGAELVGVRGGRPLTEAAGGNE